MDSSVLLLALLKPPIPTPWRQSSKTPSSPTWPWQMTVGSGGTAWLTKLQVIWSTGWVTTGHQPANGNLLILIQDSALPWKIVPLWIHIGKMPEGSRLKQFSLEDGGQKEFHSCMKLSIGNTEFSLEQLWNPKPLLLRSTVQNVLCTIRSPCVRSSDTILADTWSTGCHSENMKSGQRCSWSTGSDAAPTVDSCGPDLVKTSAFSSGFWNGVKSRMMSMLLNQLLDGSRQKIRFVSTVWRASQTWRVFSLPPNLSGWQK